MKNNKFRGSKESIIQSLWRISDQTGDVITEYHWRELSGIIASLKDIWGISDEEFHKIIKQLYPDVDESKLIMVDNRFGEY